MVVTGAHIYNLQACQRGHELRQALLVEVRVALELGMTEATVGAAPKRVQKPPLSHERRVDAAAHHLAHFVASLEHLGQLDFSRLRLQPVDLVRPAGRAQVNAKLSLVGVTPEEDATVLAHAARVTMLVCLAAADLLDLDPLVLKEAHLGRNGDHLVADAQAKLLEQVRAPREQSSVC